MSNASQNEDPWCQYIPLLHRILAASDVASAFPDVTRVATLDQACAVWETLHYLLCDILGWRSPGIGLAWWYASGKPVFDSPHLRMVRELWDRDQQLDYYAAWSFRQSGEYSPQCSLTPQHLAEYSSYHDEEWWTEFLRRPIPDRHNAFYGGTNPLHLGHSKWFGEETGESQLYIQASSRSAVLIVNSIGCWKHELLDAGDKLPDIGDRSWHIEIFDRQTGYLGLFRRSRISGLWFQGKHSVHLRGNDGNDFS